MFLNAKKSTKSDDDEELVAWNQAKVGKQAHQIITLNQKRHIESQKTFDQCIKESYWSNTFFSFLSSIAYSREINGSELLYIMLIF